MLDIGCGRGEFLELLAELGVEASGVEIDPALVTEGREGGDSRSCRRTACATWRRCPTTRSAPSSCSRWPSTWPPSRSIDIVAMSRVHKVRDGGMLVVETVNPQSLYTFAHSFYLDPTHSQPRSTPPT